MAEPLPEEFNMLGGALGRQDSYPDVAPQGFLSRLLYGNVLGETPADQALNRAGSMMGSAKTMERESQARQGPLLSTLSDLVNFANPIDWMGGFGGGAAAAGPGVRRMGGKVFREAASAAPMVRESGGKVFKSGPQQFAELAKAGTRPVTETYKMFPALIDERTGQVIHSMKPGAYQHDSLYGALPKNFQPTRGFVDPLTFQAFTEKMLEGLKQY